MSRLNLTRSQILFLLSSVFVIFCAFKFFAYKKLAYQVIPATTDILDEKNYIWAAKSFLQTGIPTAWSNLEAYGNKARNELQFDGVSIVLKGEKPSVGNIAKFNYPAIVVSQIDVGKGNEHLRFVQPFLDHSFFAGLIYGLTTPTQTKSVTEVRAEEYRLVAIYVSLVTSLLLFFLTYLLDGHPLTAIFSFFIYGTATVYLLSSRYSLIENLLVPQTLFCLLFLVLSKKDWFTKLWQKRLLWVLAGVWAGLALATKELGIALVLAGVFILLNYRVARKNLFWFLLPAVLIGSSFYLYALAVSPKLFIAVFQDQTKRGFFGSLNFLHSFYRPYFSGFPLEGWWPFGFICLAFLAQEFKKHQEILLGFASFLFIFLFFGGLNHPWYWLSFVPFLVMASAVFLKNLVLNPSVLKIFIFFLFPFSSSFYWGRSVFHDSSINLFWYRAFILFFLTLTGFCYLARKLPSLKIVITLILLAILFIVLKWNQQGFTYIIANWGRLPEPFFLKF